MTQIKKLHTKILFRKHLIVLWTGVSTPQLGQLNINKFTIMEECKKRNCKHKSSALKKTAPIPQAHPHREKTTALTSPSSLCITVRHPFPSLPNLHITAHLWMWPLIPLLLHLPGPPPHPQLPLSVLLVPPLALPLPERQGLHSC